MFFPCTKISSDGGKNIPILIHAESINLYVSNSISYTFTSKNVFQIYVWSGGNTTATVKINNEVITPYNVIHTSNYYYVYEVECNIGDVLLVENNSGLLNYGLQLYICTGADISVFELIGERGNDNTTFNINRPGEIFIEPNKFSYYGVRNVFYYAVIVGYDGLVSIPTPNDSPYYYGGTFCFRLI